MRTLHTNDSLCYAFLSSFSQEQFLFDDTIFKEESSLCDGQCPFAGGWMDALRVGDTIQYTARSTDTQDDLTVSLAQFVQYCNPENFRGQKTFAVRVQPRQFSALLFSTAKGAILYQFADFGTKPRKFSARKRLVLCQTGKVFWAKGAYWRFYNLR